MFRNPDFGHISSFLMKIWNLVFFFEIIENQRYFDIVGTYPRNIGIKRGPPALGGRELQ